MCVVVANLRFVPLSHCSFALKVIHKQHSCLIASIFIFFFSNFLCVSKKGKVNRVRHSQSQWVAGASHGSCVLGVHYCNEGRMTATLAGPQAAQYG